ncbi:beta-glucosidase [Mycolicibacterium sarraceniae]|uniref:Exo-alpha-(1->6)-L-arabinopyranosidase n=2 Tax=Mycolicibacterium sarraceniae TaxID=1534348 RepID=A0A7I7SX73_9MYCO|nr:beta-glucosidase [Mycolicibacterium sarraceniae]
MTTEEKVQQLTGIIPVGLLGEDGVSPQRCAEHLSAGIGHISMIATIGNKGPAAVAAATNEIQRYLVTGTRLGIPAIVHNEALNGVVSAGFTAFPTAIGLAATWDTAAVEKMADILRRQQRAVGIRQALSPVLDVARDARWGRVYETYGEDPYLISAMGVAYVRGTQGTDPTDAVLATAKHFLGYSWTEGGQNMARSTMGNRLLYDVFARPFEAAIKLAGLESVMNSYSEIDGVPVGINRAVLTGLLRERMGFAGVVVADYTTTNLVRERQRAASTAEEVAALALHAGLDVELPMAYAYGSVLAEAVDAGRIPAAELDASVLRVLEQKYRLGLFDQPYVLEDPILISTVAGEGRDLSLHLAGESLTLLKNDGTLPLARDTTRVAVIGPHAHDPTSVFAGYTYPAMLDMMRAMAAGHGTTQAGVDGLENLLDPSASGAFIADLAPVLMIPRDQYARDSYGATSLVEEIQAQYPASEVTAAMGVGVTADEPRDVADALAAARDADVVVLALGGRCGWFSDRTTEGEGGDSANIELPQHQIELVDAVAQLGKPMIAVVYGGRPFALTELERRVGVILWVYYPGPFGNQAIAQALVGAINPGGKLPYTLPRHSGQIPIYSAQHWGSGYRRTDTDMFTSYLDMSATPLYPFGHGLSYTTFEYSDLEADDTVAADGAFRVAVSVTNTGRVGGDEVVQVYVSDEALGLTRPARELVGFQRITLEEGATAHIEFTIGMAQLAYTGIDGTLVMEPGPIQVLVGSSADDIRLSTEVEVTGKTVNYEGRREFLSEAHVTTTR